MRTKQLFLCMLFLLLGTSAAWADKYYMPGSYKGQNTPRLTPEQAIQGKKFMIYNTAINVNPTQDRTGFLRNNGSKVELDKTKERDLLVYNESFVYTMEGFDDNSDGVNDWYAIKSITTGTYVDIDGNTTHSSADAAKLYIYSWDNAADNGAVRSGVAMESWKYNIIENNKITSEGHGSTVFVVKNGSTYWNGNTDSFATWGDAHPYAFYEVYEVTGGDYLQDLHIYSRCDIYSAQVIYGYVQNRAKISTSPATVDNTANIIDGTLTTSVTTGEGGGNHYFEFDLGKSTSSLYLYMQRNADKTNVPTQIRIEASTDGSSWTQIPGTHSTSLADNPSWTSGAIDLGAEYSYIRIVNTTAGAKMSISEIAILPNNPKVVAALAYFATVTDPNSPVYTKATARVYGEKVEEYNNLFSDARLLSGVPLPGNKYRIYADAYDRTNGVYTNKEIYTDNLATPKLLMEPAGTYSTLSDEEQKKYEWYCEQTNDGFLVFKNVANPALYLGNCGISTDPYKWSINTVLTQRHGVPLRNEAQQYLAAFNDGSEWMGNVKNVQDQTTKYTFTNDNDTPDDTSDDTEETIDCGVCTDFVFIPVEVDASEKKVTFKANELVRRNIVFRYDNDGNGEAEALDLPYARMFLSTADAAKMPTLTLRCPEYHTLDGFYVNGTKKDNIYSLTDGVYTFIFDELNDCDIVEIRLNIVEPFKIYGTQPTEESGLYLIRNKRLETLPQQAGPNRTNINIGGDTEGDRVSTVTGGAYYANFTKNNEHIGLVLGDFDATSLFYFEKTSLTDTDEYYNVFIRNATTSLKCETPNSWSTVGESFFVQPAASSTLTGYAITRTRLTANTDNDAGDAWCSNHANQYGKSIVLDYNPTDDGAMWEFVAVSKDDATTMLKDFIDKECDNLKNTVLPALKGTGLDDDKIDTYISFVTEFQTASAALTANDVAALVTNAQQIHMLSHELSYALQELPLHSSKDDMGDSGNFEAPHWYYMKNVKSDGYYAKYTSDSTSIALDNSAKRTLSNLFFFEGEKVSDANLLTDDIANQLTIDEYLQVRIHNFMAGTKSVISKNNQIFNTKTVTTGVETTITESLDLKSNDSWSITLEYDLAGTAFNAYGSSLLASTGDPTDDEYYDNFQVYFKDDRSIVVKVNNADDRYRFWHTQSAFEHIKVVLTYALGNVTVDVYNADNVKETIVVTGTVLDPITTLSAALPATGATLTNLNVESVEAMKWGEGAADGSDNTWYILPSSNQNEVGNAIVMEGASDANMGWTNVNGDNSEVFTDLGSADNSTWQFERVTDFDDHLYELLAMYNLDNVVIYNKELVELYNLIERNSVIIEAAVAGAGEEEAFNEIYEALKNYTGPKPEELRAPKPGKFYTIYPASDVEEVEMCVHVDKTADEISTNEVNRTTKIVTYNGDDNVEHDEYNSRGVWFFEGTADGDGFLPTTGIQLNNLHTQTQLNALDANGALLTEEGALDVTLATKGGAKVAIQAGGNNMARGDVASRSIVAAATDREFAADHATVTFDWEGNSGEIISKENINSNMVATDKGSVSFTTSHDIMIGGNIETTVFCTKVNGNTSPTIEHTFEFSGLGDSFTFNHIALDIHAFNSGKNYQYNYDGVSRQWNVKAEVSNGEDDFTEFFTLTDIDIAAGVGETGNVHQKWGLAGNEFTTTTGELVVKLTITKGTNNSGCFFGLSEVTLSNVGDVWYIEEIEEPEYIYHLTNTAQHGHGTLKLGFPALIPEGVEAFHAKVHGDIRDDRYISMVSYGEPTDETRILPSNTAVMLRNVNGEAETKEFKFYYSENDATPVADNYIHGVLYNTIIDCSSYDTTDFDGDGNADGDVNIYMLQASKNTAKLFWIYEERSADGTIKDGNANTDNGGYIICKANRAFMVLPKIQVAETTSFSLRFGGGETTDIEDVIEEGSDVEIIESIYDLQGRRLDEITEPGIYIINGKKVFIK